MTTGATLRTALAGAAVLATSLQACIEPTAVNVLCSVFVLISTGIVLLYITWTDALQTHPLSTYAILGFCIVSQLGALLVQTAAWTPLVFLLYNPLRTFGLLALFQLVALGTHVLFRAIYSQSHNVHSPLKNLFMRLDVYRIPSASALWIIGFVGLGSFSLASADGIIAKLADGFNFLAWAPFLIPSYAMSLGSRYANSKRMLWALSGYALLIAGVAVLTNVRSTMFVGIVTVSLLFLFNGLRSERRPRSASVLKLLGGVLLLLVVMQPLSDFMIAMAVVRESQQKYAPMELLSETFHVAENPVLLDRFRTQMANNTTSSYDEFYIQSPMLAKVVETKFHDNALHFASFLSSEESKRRLRDVTIDTCLSGLPAPLLSLLRIDVDKSANVFSMGDFLVHLSVGRPLGGQKTGSQFAQGIVLFGALYPLVYAGLCFLTFYACWVLTSPVVAGSAAIPAVAMMRIWIFFQHGISQDGIAGMVILVFRGILEMVFVYVVALNVAKLFLRDKYAFK